MMVIILAALMYRGLCFPTIKDIPIIASPVVDAAYHDQWAQRIAGGDLWGRGPDDVFDRLDRNKDGYLCELDLR